MIMIICKDESKAGQARRNIRILIENLNRHITEFNNSGMPPMRSIKDLRSFAQDPVKYFLDQVREQAKSRNLEGSDPEEYARLFGHSFTPDLKKYPVRDYLEYMEYVKFTKVGAEFVDDIEQRLYELSIVETQTQEEEEATRLLFRLYSDFTYVSTLLNVGPKGTIQTGNARIFGFHPFQAGKLFPDAVRKLAEGMKDLSKDEFNIKLIEQSVYPGLKDVIQVPISAE